MKHLLLVAAAAIISAPVAAQTAVPAAAAAAPVGYGAPITLADAMELIDRAQKLAKARNFKMAFSAVEPSGELVAFARMDDVVYGSVHLAQQKARAAARFRLPTSEFESRVAGGRTVLLSSDEVIAIGGGVPIVANGRVIGALGVSGGSAADDVTVASAAVSD
ncbi:heme-binding protein [Novosphingobium sp. MMS21-SN21R]|uniref:GlcG/HbpS family heme-binding protein n=1 Tax=Novosphingobium sp. MMS21-SN21R TaxID=2969298 RepID=UPI0028877A44|nr:heme-binding protein [Novosphingobium sp. MMS21-SN21R]MDT0507032.1 heme-binding protein [Novosphingobium sp. MMS21-SN21R]